MAKTNSQDFYVKIYLDEFNASDYLVEQYGYEVAYKFLKAKANLYFNDEDTCPDNPIAIGFWVSGVKRRTIADREHRQHISQVRSGIRKKDKDSNCNNCNQTEQLITNDYNCNNCNNCNQTEQLITNDTINRVNRETELIELKNSPSHTREGGDAKDMSFVNTEASFLNTNTPLNTETSPLNTFHQQQRPTGGATIEAPPTIEAVLEYAKMIGCPEHLARKFFHHYEANGWVTDGDNPRPFKWQSKLAEWKVAEEAKARTRHTNASNNNKRTNKLNINDEYNDL